MAEVTSLPLHRGIPDEISIWEILVRLPPKSLLRCRAICRAWRSATSTHDFLLAHHARQPALPLFYAYNYRCGGGVESLDIIPFDHRVGVAAADRLQSIARIRDSSVRPCVSCDGLVVLHMDWDHLCIVNPATLQCARLPSFADTHRPAAMYPHSLTGEYRILLAPHDPHDSYQVYTLGSSQPPRHIDREGPGEPLSPSRPLLFHGCLHWWIYTMIIVFDTTAESFREMLPPVIPGGADQFAADEIVLFEMDRMLGMSSLHEFTSVAIWAMQDYESEAWALKYRVNLPLPELTAQFEGYPSLKMTASWDGDVTVLVEFGDWLLQIDMDGKLVASLRRRRGFVFPQHQLKQTLVQHTFFLTLEGIMLSMLHLSSDQKIML